MTKTTRRRLEPKEIDEIRRRDYNATVVRSVMIDYDLSYYQAGAILTGKSYANLPVYQSQLPPQTIGKEPKLSDEQLEEIKSTPVFWGSQTYFANKFGVS